MSSPVQIKKSASLFLPAARRDERYLREWGPGQIEHAKKAKKPLFNKEGSQTMKPSIIKFKTTTLLLIPLVLACFALLPNAQAVTSPELLPAPTPDGFYPGHNTAEGFHALFNRTTGAWDSAFGDSALFHDTTGTANTALGYNAMFSNIDGNGNTGNGTFTLFSNTHGDGNTALGNSALYKNLTGNSNTAMGANALHENTAGSFNIAVGQGALFGNTASNNVAVGYSALTGNSTGTNNVATGYLALLNNDTGNYNTASGFEALFHNVNGATNTATGPGALFSNIDGFGNTATGANFVLYNNTHGTGNTADGSYALANNIDGHYNTGEGWATLFNNQHGTANTAIGVNAGYNITGSGNIAIGVNVFGAAGFNNTTWIGNVGSTPQASGAYVTVDHVQAPGSGGQYRLGWAISSRRYKEDIKPMDKASEALYGLKPVTYRCKGDVDPAHVQEYGLIAEDVAEVNPDLVVYDSDGKPATFRFLSIQGMMLNEFLKEHKKVEEQQASIADLKSTVALQQKEMQILTAQLKEQAAQIQKVSAQVEMSKPAPAVVANQ
jgi:trimeric autotransporter adhesin